MAHAQTFHARVADDAISKVTSLFNASLDDIFAELIQNARRAGASSVSIDPVMHDRLGPAIRVSDNGPGIADPRSLFTLGHSAWDGATIRAEDAAGMGFFALAGRRIHLIAQEAGTARSWALDADPSAFKGERPITCMAGPDGHAGVTIWLEARSGESLVAAANRAALYCPIEVRVDGVVAERKDFLEGADHVERWNGIRIGLFDRERFRGHGNVNFHGVTLHADLPRITQVFHRAYHARIDVIDCAELKLVLPARKEIVADGFFETLKRRILKMMFRRIAVSGPHSLPCSRWSEARSLGVDLPPAARILRPFSPRHADRDSTDLKSPEPVIADSLLVESEDEPIDEQNLAWALSGHDEVPSLYEPENSYRGYGWYDALPRLTVSGYRLCHGDDVERLALGETSPVRERPDRLFVEGRIGTASDLTAWQLETDVLILGLDAFSDPDDVDLSVAKTSRIGHADLIDLLTRALFCPSDDVDAGSYDEQLRWFTDRAEDRVIELLDSDAEANINAVIRVVSRELYWLKTRDRDVTIRIAGGQVSVTGLESEAGPRSSGQ